MSESELRCNNLKCRALLSTEGKAVVTNCSHIFCINCANTLFTSAQICPACETRLAEPDDIVISSLSPTSDYKSSILAGLSPATIMEITTRALSFWTYQTGQEGAFQGMVLKNAQERLMSLERGLNTVNEELQAANQRISSLLTDMEAANCKNGELLQKHADHDREYTKLRANYDKLKRKHLIGSAAEMADAVNDQVQYASEPAYASNFANKGYGSSENVENHPMDGQRPTSSGSGGGHGQRSTLMRSIMSTPSGQPQQFIPSSVSRLTAQPHSGQTRQRGSFQPNHSYGSQHQHQHRQQQQQQHTSLFVQPRGIPSATRQPLAYMSGLSNSSTNPGSGNGFAATGSGYGNVAGASKRGVGVIRTMPAMQPRRL